MSGCIGKLETSIPIRRPAAWVGKAAPMVPVDIGFFSRFNVVIHSSAELSEQPVLQFEVFLETPYFGIRRKLFIEFSGVPHAEIGPVTQIHDERNQQSEHSTRDPTGEGEKQPSKPEPPALCRHMLLLRTMGISCQLEHLAIAPRIEKEGTA